MRQWQREFSEEFAIPQSIEAIVNAGILCDDSWHNDVCPKFYVATHSVQLNTGEVFTLWVEHPNREMRECDSEYRYEVTVDAADGDNMRSLYRGDDIEFVERIIRSIWENDRPEHASEVL